MAKSISKTHINFWLDAFLLIVFLVLCWSSIIVRYVFPPALKSEGWMLWSLDYLAWTDVQFVTLCIMTASVLLHIMMHWTWVCGVVTNWYRKRTNSPVQQDNGSRTLWGVGLLIVILNVLGLAIAIASLTIHGPVQ